jgi:membrane protein implicated in regulation of membrane protease activity
MTWSDFYLICFIVGILLTAVSLVLGDIHLHLHLPFHVHFGGLHVGGPHVPHGPGGGPHIGAGQLPAFNLATMTAFLAWFGGIGYLLTVHSNLYGMAALGIALVGGLVGASLIFIAISKIILRHEDVEFESGDLVGMLGRITSTVFEQGTGELVYVQRGTRHTCAARTEDGSGVPKGTEVIVTRYEKGIAYVRPWEEMAHATFGSDSGRERSE